MSKVKCNHCHLEFSESIMIKEEELNFCCKGCQGVYHLLQDQNLDSFYDKLGSKTIQPPLEVSSDLNKFDTQSFEKIYVTEDENGYKKVDLIIEGIHCAACIWLNEKVLYNTDGIIDANINFTNNKAKVVWNSKKIALSQIIEKIRSIGYNAFAYNSKIADEKASLAKRDYFIRMMVAVFATMNIMMLSVGKYTGFFTGITPEVKHLMNLGEFILATPVLFYSGWIFYRGAYYGLKNRILNMDFLVSVGATFTYIYSVFILFGLKGESYFDSVSMIITFVLVGKYLEVLGKKSAVDTLDTIKSQIPLETTLIKDGNKIEVSVEDIQIGDIVELKTGDKASVDGIIIKGESSFDESSISGESLPIYKKVDDVIYSGTLNQDSLVQYRVTKTFKDSTLNSIVTLLEDSLASKPKIEHKANEISKGFSVMILTLSILTFFVWYYFGINLGFDYDGVNHFEKSFIVAISVIVIACPCALALATPIASLIGISELAKKGLLFKEAKFIEELARTTKLVVDKTGTITNGKLSIVKAQILDENIHKLDLLYSLLDSSTHPISISIKEYLKNHYKDLSLKNLINVKTLQAKGMFAKYKNLEDKEFEILGGNQKLIEEFGIKYKFDSQNSVYIFAINKKVIATFELKDEIKDFAKEFVSDSLKNNIDVIMLTGDNENVANYIANEVGIKTVVANINPIQKAKYINKLKEEGHTVVMAGDGVNDSVALSSANVSIAMGNGADISIAVSDIVLLNNSLESLNQAFIISRKTYKFIKQNLTISLIYNLVTIPLAMAGFVIPLVAALSMSLSSLIVVANSLRIKGK
ncbi:heavy metal translocating P-type ATPase [Arcobacter nitrofigilis DSM 7299]|uniref:Copper-transporting ATPase n=1 Tax=Arcobacter nitrofigilis (strain ATCC 33309 / DSM 7299 / CCUG 15893 / LMG 7604 / NCTC 12251 / CI) TaxID=572480 RepID=D5V2L7_ARCNC|nr:heavy metal translocating P-type ATPase [Arcobacter nitrofigilis]ADG92449.1 heavy metal translocating P-type ATPase [Arcobacter nitrofigilis DSM 7299]